MSVAPPFREMSEREHRSIINCQRVLPSQLARARARVSQLEEQARRYAMEELLTNPKLVDKAWGRMVEIAKLKAGQ